MRSRSLLLLPLVTLLACGNEPDAASEPVEPTAAVAVSPSGTGPLPGAELTRIALGSCNRTDLPQPIWDAVLAADPQLWVWLGDNVYGDTDDMSVMRAKYDAQIAQPGYTSLRETAGIVGTWDDHDFGANNAGSEYPMRAESQQAALDFLGVPEDDPLRDREGLYSSHTYGPEGRRVKVILLDSRYHRDERGSDGTILGEEQWGWLESELADSDAQIHLIGNGIQVLPEDHRYEKWANFPSERRRLFDLVGSTGVPGVVLLSGDRHISELSRVEDPAIGYPLWELTSSGMTHSWDDISGEENRHRVGELFQYLNFGLIEIDWSAGVLTLQVRGVDGEPGIDRRITFEELGLG